MKKGGGKEEIQIREKEVFKIKEESWELSLRPPFFPSHHHPVLASLSLTDLFFFTFTPHSKFTPSGPVETDEGYRFQEN